MCNRLEIFEPDRRKIDEIDAPVRRLGVVLAAIHGDAMAAADKARSQFFRERFEAAVVCRDPASA